MDKYNRLKEVFEKNQDTASSIDMAAYMQNNFIFYGIDAKKRKELEKEFIRDDKKNKEIDFLFLNKCYNDEHREMHYFVLDYLDSLCKYLTVDDIEKLEYYVNHNQWWDSIDKLDKLIGNIDVDNKEIDELMLKWSLDDNIWKRRLAIDHQMGRKDKTNNNLLKEIIINNLGSKEFFINKAIGWSLREYSKTNPEWVKNFINNYKDKLDKLSIREASKYI